MEWFKYSENIFYYKSWNVEKGFNLRNELFTLLKEQETLPQPVIKLQQIWNIPFFSIPDWTNSLVLKSISHIFDDYMSIFNLLYNKKKEMANNKMFQNVLSKPNVSQCKHRLRFVVSLCFRWFRTLPFMANIYMPHK